MGSQYAAPTCSASVRPLWAKCGNRQAEGPRSCDQRSGLRAAREQPSRAVAPASRPGRDLSRRTRRSLGRVGATAGPSAQDTAADAVRARVLAGDAAIDLELLV